MSLRSEVHNGIDLLLFKNVGYQIGRANISLHELKVGQLGNLVKIGKTRAVVKTIVHDNLVLGILLAKKNDHM